ncbi:hypothetical protein [Microvirga zambiensis]|nr:hypothetical protein [Microvirga zambiensis]
MTASDTAMALTDNTQAARVRAHVQAMLARLKACLQKQAKQPV